RIVAVAGARPDSQGVPLTRWSLPRLSAHLAGEGIEVSPRHLGSLLAEAGLSFQRTRTWKASPDPDYEAKAARILELCETRPPDGPVVSFDQMGPISLRPTPGAGWAPLGRPERQRADYNRRAGIRYVFGAYDVHADRLRVRLRSKRAGADTLARLHAPDPARLPGPAAHLLDPGQPLRQLGTRDSRLRRRQPDRARPNPDLRQLPQPRRMPLLRAQPVRRLQRRLPRLGRLRPRARTPRPLPKQRTPRPTNRRSRGPTPHRRLRTGITMSSAAF